MFDNIAIEIDVDQLLNMAKDTIVVISRASILHVMALVIDRSLESIILPPF
jgi:hypothetical protein